MWPVDDAYFELGYFSYHYTLPCQDNIHLQIVVSRRLGKIIHL